MRLHRIALPVLASALAYGSAAAHEDAHSRKPSIQSGEIRLAQMIVPEAEREAAQKLEMEGPKKHIGIDKVEVLGTVPLAGEFASPDGIMLRAREVLIAPEGVVAVHRHNGRPGVAYIISGEMTEHRAGASGPLVKKAGDTAFEKTGVAHWWKNTGKTTAKLIVVDLIPTKE